VEAIATEPVVLKDAEDVLHTTTELLERPMYRHSSARWEIQRVMLKVLPDLPQARLLPPLLPNNHQVKATRPWLSLAKTVGLL